MNFGKHAHEYELYAEPQKDLITWGLDYINPGPGAALELGAGTGLFTRHLLKAHPKLIASDIAPGMILEGKRRLPEVDWQIHDAFQAFHAQQSIIYSASFLQWVHHPERVLKNWRQSLKPGGRIVALFFTLGTLSELASLTHFKSPIVWRSGKTWASLFTQAGFQKVRYAESPRTYYYPSSAGLLKSLHRTGTTPQSAAMRPGCLRRLLQAYNRHFNTPFGVKATWHFCKIDCIR